MLRAIAFGSRVLAPFSFATFPYLAKGSGIHAIERSEPLRGSGERGRIRSPVGLAEVSRRHRDPVIPLSRSRFTRPRDLVTMRSGREWQAQTSQDPVAVSVRCLCDLSVLILCDQRPGTDDYDGESARCR